MVVVLGSGETCVGAFLDAPGTASGVFETSSPASVGENYDALRYDASGYAVAPKRGVAFDGTIYRSPYPGTGPKVIDKYNIAANHRYSASGEGALYFSTNQRTVVKELGGSLAEGRTIHAFDGRIDNLLDLSNPAVRSNLGVSLDDLVRTSGDDIYSVTQQLGRYARDQGFGGIIAPSARADGGLNLILFQAP